MKLRDLVSAKELNGRQAICLGLSACGTRWLVHVDGEDLDRVRRVPAEKLEMIAESTCACDPSMRRLDQLQMETVQLREKMRAVKLAPDVVVRGIADMECLPLKQCMGPKERGDWKRRLMLKWHPDKAASHAHRDLATQVSQAMQSHPEWRA